jgi:hypothetical protein
MLASAIPIHGGTAYIAAAINVTASAAPHSVLATTDELVKIVGAVDLGAVSQMGHTLVF